MITPEQSYLLRALKGAPISLLFALALAHEPVGRDQLVLITGWGRDKVTEGLNVLAHFELASPLMRFNGWTLTAKVAQLGLFEGEKIALDDGTATALPSNSIAALSSSSSSFEGDKIALDPDVINALHSAGIGEPTASRLAALPHVSVSYIQAHAIKAKDERISTGLLVHRIRSADPPPELNAFGHLAGCECGHCARMRFQEGVQ